MSKNKDQKPEVKELSVEEAKKLRAAKYASTKRELSEEEKREEFRIFWAQAKSKYKQGKEIEEILWVHLKAIKKDEPKDFEAGIKHFGLQKIGQ